MKKRGFLIMLVLLMLLPVQAMASKQPADGRYTVEVALSGGSGRATVESPARLTVADGAATATVIWSSPYYEYMRLDGVTYYPVSTDGNSTFEIPVILDENMAVSAQTIAMSEPHEIDYTLHFDSATLKPLVKTGFPLLPHVAGGAAILIAVLAGIFLYKKCKREQD